MAMKLKWPWAKQEQHPDVTDPIALAATQSINAGKDKQRSEKSHWLWRLLKISPFGILRLAFYSVIVGFFMIVVDVKENPEEVIEATALTYTKHAMQLGLQALGWAAENFWEPALLGATIVVPVWLAWRLVSLPFRK